MKNSAALIRIRQMCHLALPAEILVLSAIRELKSLVPRSSAAFFWFDSEGNITNCCAECLPFEPDWLAQNSSPGQEDFVERILAANVAGAVVCARVELPSNSMGRLCVYRRRGDIRLSDREEAHVDRAANYLSDGLLVSAANVHKDLSCDLVDAAASEELLICDQEGNVLHASEGSATLLMFAADVPLSPLTFSVASERARALLQAHCGSLVSDNPSGAVTHTIQTMWGRMTLRLYRMPHRHLPGNHLIAVQVRRHKASTLHLLDSMGNNGLSPRQREIALLISLGRSNAEIADVLTVSFNTVCYHVKCLFNRYGVHNRAGLLRLLSSRQLTHSVDGPA